MCQHSFFSFDLWQWIISLSWLLRIELYYSWKWWEGPNALSGREWTKITPLLNCQRLLMMLVSKQLIIESHTTMVVLNLISWEVSTKESEIKLLLLSCIPAFHRTYGLTYVLRLVPLFVSRIESFPVSNWFPKKSFVIRWMNWGLGPRQRGVMWAKRTAEDEKALFWLTFYCSCVFILKSVNECMKWLNLDWLRP